ncbi:helix-turn-helix domain-containing protein [Lelliottia wanjuensis]|uniref:helix-turn-helix domain-containing protein n=1 Tax=Lelliottia wanjuensis TaxID=3050585 RepID=UPI00254DC115|nr:helix-turn-helix domain-containing protein [Lelliottia sp. V104_15]MDK9607081.1 helix-turn-helix domain-containing protein [Lelliottia sp. V104_15]
MSMDLMVQVMKVKLGSPLRKLVLLKMADNASDTGECWPSYQHIADHCEISRRSVVSHIAALCACGFLKKKNRMGPNGNSSNSYVITLGEGDVGMLKNFKSVKSIAGAPGESDSPGSATDSLGGAAVAPGGVKEIHQGSATDSLGGGETVAPRISHSFESVIEPVNKTHRQPDKQSDDLPGKTEKPKKQKPQIDYQGCIDAYNEVLGDRLPWAKDLTNDRKIKIRMMLGRLKTPTVDGFRAYLEAFSENARSFYFGDNSRGWRANIDFLLREKTLVAVREGTISDSTEVQE